MKKRYALLLFLFLDSYFCHAQATGNDSDENRLEIVKMAYISRELNLTPQEAQNFWPVYNNYISEIKQARSQYPNDEVAFEKKVVDIKEHYKGNFQKVLGDNQRTNKVYITDKQFNTTLRNELNNRQHNRSQSFQQPQPQRNNAPPNNIKKEMGTRRVKPPL